MDKIGCLVSNGDLTTSTRELKVNSECVIIGNYTILLKDVPTKIQLMNNYDSIDEEFKGLAIDEQKMVVLVASKLFNCRYICIG